MGKTEENKSLSQTQFSNPFGTGEIVEQFEPTWVKLDKQVRITYVTLMGSTPRQQLPYRGRAVEKIHRQQYDRWLESAHRQHIHVMHCLCCLLVNREYLYKPRNSKIPKRH
jgi:hypothetical protein